MGPWRLGSPKFDMFGNVFFDASNLGIFVGVLGTNLEAMGKHHTSTATLLFIRRFKNLYQ